MRRAKRSLADSECDDDVIDYGGMNVVGMRMAASLHFVPAINVSASVSQWRTSRRISSEPPPNFNSGRDIPHSRPLPGFTEDPLCVSRP